MTSRKDDKPATRLVHAGRDPAAQQGAVNPPVYRASTILMADMDAWRESTRPGTTAYRYGLLGTPTSRSFEAAMADMYGAEQCIAVSSGLAMITVAFMAMTAAGDHILVTDSAYDPTRHFCDTVLKRFGVTTTYYDPLLGTGIADLIRPETKLVFTESPGSLTFEVQDIPAITKAAKAAGVPVAIDNTWATPLYFNPFEHGVDIVLEATTKYVAGHSDVILGVMLANGRIGSQLYRTAKALGICSGADDLYLAQRGLRSLGLRLGRSGETGRILADWLAKRPEVKRVLHPALPGCPGHEIFQRDFTGAAGLFSIVLQPVDPGAVDRFMNALRLFGIGVSWGGYESLAIAPNPRLSRSAIPWTEPGQLVRFYAGLEDPGDLIADLDQAFTQLTPTG